MIKKIILSLFIALLLMGMNLNMGVTFAQPAPPNNGTKSEQTEKKPEAEKNKTVDDLFHPYIAPNGAPPTKIDYVQKLPSGSWQEILTGVIKFVLGITGTLAFISFSFAGILFVTARGEEDQLTKAKHLLIWSIAALGIIAVSYAIVLGISQLKFFS